MLYCIGNAVISAYSLVMPYTGRFYELPFITERLATFGLSLCKRVQVVVFTH
eukprot:m.213814 g.213814  ORF g.213814 m.213814 type:complete len:52 (+) comp15090_c0_seq12:50-205(+)